jgi:4-O-beta-D-mannosyl-D-glucose phosphorylase
MLKMKSSSIIASIAPLRKKNGLGPAPIKTVQGWLRLAHGVRNTAAGLRYVLYRFLSEVKRPYVITHRPGGYFLAPQGEKRVGDVSNVACSNAWITTENGDVYSYYGASDTRLNVVTSTVERLLDPLRSFACVETRIALIRKNLAALKVYGKLPGRPPAGRVR